MFPFEEDTEEENINEEEEEWYPKEYEVDFATGKLTGKIVEGSKAIAAWCYLALLIPRYKYYQYSWDYGSELRELIGSNNSDEYIESEVNRFVTECVSENPYVNGIENIQIERQESTLKITFTIITDYGEEEVDINV